VKEAGLSPDAGVIEKGDLTIEKILEEKKVFDLSLNFERLGAREGTGWSNRGTAFWLPDFIPHSPLPCSIDVSLLNTPNLYESFIPRFRSDH